VFGEVRRVPASGACSAAALLCMDTCASSMCSTSQLEHRQCVPDQPGVVVVAQRQAGPPLGRSATHWATRVRSSEQPVGPA
jgi:hypothetical protein